MLMKPYIASRFKNKDLVKEVAKHLFDVGVATTQRWPNEAEGCTPVEAATRDIEDMDESNCLMLLTEGCESVPGGMHFEMGYTYAQGKPVYVVGPKVHVFCHLPDVKHFETVDELIAYFSK
jgi:hypothetical protein